MARGRQFGQRRPVARVVDVDAGHEGLLVLIAGRGWFRDGRAAHAACAGLPDTAGSTDSARKARRILPSRPTHGAKTRP